MLDDRRESKLMRVIFAFGEVLCCVGKVLCFVVLCFVMLLGSDGGGGSSGDGGCSGCSGCLDGCCSGCSDGGGGTQLEGDNSGNDAYRRYTSHTRIKKFVRAEWPASLL